MRFGSKVFVAASIVAFAPPALAQQGSYADPLRKMLGQVAQGTCPSDIMGDSLLAACGEQIANMRAGLAAWGPITAMKFVRAEEQASGRVETYEVTFASGQTMAWTIGDLREGKFHTAYSRR